MADYNTVLPSNITSQSNTIEKMTHQSGCNGWGEYLGICKCKPEERLNLIFSIMNAYRNDSKVILFCRNELQKIADCPSNYKNADLQLQLKKFGIGQSKPMQLGNISTIRHWYDDKIHPNSSTLIRQLNNNLEKSSGIPIPYNY